MHDDAGPEHLRVRERQRRLRTVVGEHAQPATDRDGEHHQPQLVGDRFTLIAPDAYRQDYLEIKLFNVRGEELARESLYADDGEDDDEDEDEADEPTPPAA